MKKRLKKHIEEQNFVKIYLADEDGFELTHFEGIIFDQNEDFILMCDLEDFSYDGFVVFRKSDISEIKRTDNEIFFDSIIKNEGIKEELIQKASSLDFSLGSMTEMFSKLFDDKQAIIIERLYETKTKFQIGPISKVVKKKVFIDYFNAKGEYDLKPVTSKFKDITYFRIDSPYSNLFFKYSKRID